MKKILLEDVALRRATSAPESGARGLRRHGRRGMLKDRPERDSAPTPNKTGQRLGGI